MKVLYILLTILKILGLILAGILALILLILIMVLFVPIRYEADASYKGKPEVSVRISYLLHLILIKFDLHEGQSKFVVKILGFTLGKNKNRNKKKKKKRNKVRNKSVINSKTNSDILSENNELNSDIEFESDMMAKPEDDYIEEEPNDFGFATEDDIIEMSENKRSRKNKRPKKNFFKNLKVKFDKLSDMYHKYSEIINDKGNIRAFKVMLNSIAKIIKHVKPKKNSLYLVFGLDNPATTGELIGLIYSFRFLSGLNINVIPDFEKKIIEAELHIKGRIRCFNLAVIALRTYFNKDFKRALKQIRE